MLEAEGDRFRLNVKATRVQKTSNGVILTLDSHSKTEEFAGKNIKVARFDMKSNVARNRRPVCPFDWRTRRRNLISDGLGHAERG
jgi:hypothetical protein